jgi:hypothetical protein
MNLGDFMLSEISQSQKDMLCESTYMRHIEQSNSDTAREWWLPFCGTEMWELLCIGYSVSVLHFKRVNVDGRWGWSHCIMNMFNTTEVYT